VTNLSPFEQLVSAIEARKEVVEDFMRRRNVVACGVGYKIAGNQQTITPSVMVSVEEKLPKKRLLADELIPPRVDGVYTDVVETGIIEAQGLSRTAVVRPVMPGVSVGHLNGTAGTAGCLVRRGNQLFILSNNHVLADLNRGRIGDVIVQPGPRDGGTLSDKIAELAGFIKIMFSDEMPTTVSASAEEPAGCAAVLAGLAQIFSSGAQRPTPGFNFDNQFDAAYARIADGVAVSSSIVDLGGAPTGVVAPHLGMRVMKSGRTSGVTLGRVMQIDVTVNVRYEGRPARFTDQIMLSPMSERGDSGALVVDEERKAVGLLFSGSDKVSIATPIQIVLAELQLQLITDQVAIPRPA